MAKPGTTGVSGGYTAPQLAVILTELQGDPKKLGYAAYAVNGDYGNQAVILNAIRDGVTPCPNNGIVGPTGAITGATNATPVVITSANHSLATNDTVIIAGVGGNTIANNGPTNVAWTITVLAANTFSLNGSVGNGAYTSGGTWQWCANDYANGSPIPAAMVSAFAILNAMLKTDLAAATPNAAECAWLNALFTSTPDNITLLTASGAENNVMGNLKQFVGGGATTSGQQLTALKYRLGSRGEQALNLSGQSPGYVVTNIDVAAAYNGGY